MANTRDFKSLGEVAVNADEVQFPDTPTRVQGEAYRNTSFSEFQQNQGKQFGVVPVSENVNQQVFNQSQFTNLTDHRGFPGWRNTVEYMRPAITTASDGKIYFSKRDNNINQDPVLDLNSDWWGVFVGAENLDSLYANQTEGEEGATLIGTTARYRRTLNKSTDRAGLTVQESVDELKRRLIPMNNLHVLASGQLFVNLASSTLSIVNSFNISGASFIQYSKMANPGGRRIGHVTVTFANLLPASYIAMVHIEPRGWRIRQTASGVTRYLVHSTSMSVADKTSASIKVGSLMLANFQGQNFGGNWPPEWGAEDPGSRREWIINLNCYVIDT